jgi:hypothetical protein
MYLNFRPWEQGSLFETVISKLFIINNIAMHCYGGSIPFTRFDCGPILDSPLLRQPVRSGGGLTPCQYQVCCMASMKVTFELPPPVGSAWAAKQNLQLPCIAP